MGRNHPPLPDLPFSPARPSPVPHQATTSSCLSPLRGAGARRGGSREERTREGARSRSITCIASGEARVGTPILEERKLRPRKVTV